MARTKAQQPKATTEKPPKRQLQVCLLLDSVIYIYIYISQYNSLLYTYTTAPQHTT